MHLIRIFREESSWTSKDDDFKITVIPVKKTIKKGNGGVFSLDRPPLIDVTRTGEL